MANGHGRTSLPQLAERIERNKEATDARFDKLEESLRWINRLIISSAVSIIIAVILGFATKGFGF